MAARIADDVLDSIRDRASIVEVVSGHVALKKSGANYVGLCPFHAEKTPSFTVSDDRGLYHCFGCGEGGTVFTFLMKADGLEFREAVEQLAARVGVDLPTDDRTSEDRDYRLRLFQLNEAAQRRYRAALEGEGGVAAREYLHGRGLTDVTIERFGLGHCPRHGSAFIRALGGKPAAERAAEEIGLVGRRDDGRLYERMWGRVTFPIRDGSGRILGFGGRAMGDQQPKYLNSPESPLFHKGSSLYGIHEARAAIRESDEIVLVEGYMDVVSLAQAGVGNTVANLGTALTEAQVRLARRFASRVVAFFDGDRAGQAAALRAVEVFESLCAETGVEGFAALLPDGEDPDTHVQRHGLDATRELLNDATPLWVFFLDHVDPGPSASLSEREAAARRVAAVIAKVRDPVRLSLMARDAAERLNVSEELFRLRDRTPRRPLPDTDSAPSEESSSQAEFRIAPEEAALLEVITVDRDACRLAEQRQVERLLSPVGATVAEAIARAWETHDSAESVLDQMPSALARRISASLLGQGPLAETGSRIVVVEDSISRLERRAAEARLRDAGRRLQDAVRSGDAGAVRARLMESDDLRPSRRVPQGDAER